MSNPYDTDNYRGKFKIVYHGLGDGYHVYRVVFTGHKGLDACMFRHELTTWLFDELDPGSWFMGNGFGDSKDHPEIGIWSRTTNKNGTDCFVLLKHTGDTVRFMEAFEVTGFNIGTKAA